MTKPELHNLAEKVNQRDSYRKLLLLLLLGLVFGALLLVPRTSPHRDYYIWAIIILAWVSFIFVMRFRIRRTADDCHEFAAKCPQCGAPLFSALYGIRKTVRTGFCPKCHCRLYDDVVV